MKFYPSVTIELKRTDLIKKGDDYIGQTVRANFIKNRFVNIPYFEDKDIIEKQELEIREEMIADDIIKFVKNFS